MDTKRLMGMMNAPAHKRYKSFCTQAADTEEVWLMQDAPDAPVRQLLESLQDELDLVE